MTEQGNDAMLAEVGNPDQVMIGVRHDQLRRDEEEHEVAATSPATDEPGRDYTIPDAPIEG